MNLQSQLDICGLCAQEPGSKWQKRTGYQAIYRGEVVHALEQVWVNYGYLSSKGLQPLLSEAMRILERSQEIELPQETKKRLLKSGWSASISACVRSTSCRYTA